MEVVHRFFSELCRLLGRNSVLQALVAELLGDAYRKSQLVVDETTTSWNGELTINLVLRHRQKFQVLIYGAPPPPPPPPPAPSQS